MDEKEIRNTEQREAREGRQKQPTWQNDAIDAMRCDAKGREACRGSRAILQYAQYAQYVLPYSTSTLHPEVDGFILDGR
jgi:hypothetical protein